MHIACKSMSILACVATTLFAAGLPPAATAAPPVVWTQHNDNSRTGSNTAENILAPSNVDETHFGKVATYTLDDQSYSQPLYIPGVFMPGDGQVHNVVYETTVSNSVYAFDADGLSAAPLWTVNLTPSGQRPPTAQDESNLGACGGGYRDFAGRMGIVGTPVIDTSTNTMYLVSRYVDIATSSKFVQKLHALDITNGAEKFGGPVTIAATAADGATFDPAINNQRPALALVHGVVYIGWSSHCDNGPYHGWLIGYKASNLTKVTQWNSTDKNSWAGGIWMSGQGVTAIDPGTGNPNIYLMTGNGTWDGINNFGESFVKFNTSSTGVLTRSDFFTPANWNSLNNQDNDLGSSGPLNIPGSNLIFGGGKQGMAYLVNIGNMGHENGSDNVVQEFQATAPRGGGTGHIHGSPVYLDSVDANGNEAKYVYLWGENDFLHTYQFTPNGQLGLLTSTSVADSAEYAPETNAPGMPGGFLSLSSNAGANGIIWALTPFDGDANQDTRPGILYAYDASNFTGTGATKALTKLWSSETNAARDTVGNYAKFTYPTIANGKVYVSSWADTYSGSGQLIVYGLVSNPVPVVNSLSPTGAVVGSAAYTLTVNGTNFVPGAVARWDGNALATTFVSSTQVTAQVPAANVSTVGTHAITVNNPGPGGGLSNAVNEKVVGIANMTSVSPLTAVVGSPAITLTVIGTAFNSSTKVQWDGADLATTFVSATKLTAALPATDLAVAGRFTITVSNGAPGSGTGSAVFTVTGLATFYGLISHDFDSSPMAGITVDLVDSQGTHFDAVSSGFSSAGIDSSPANFAIGQLGAGKYTLTVTAAAGIAIPAVPATVTIPASGGLRQDVVITAVHDFPAGLQMFSVPDDYGTALPSVLLAGLGSSNVATWNAPAFTYVLDPTPPADKLSRGRGYWVRATNGLGLYGGHTAADPSVPFSVALTAGWNMIGDPFNTNINIIDLRSGTVDNQFPAAQLISPSLYGYDATLNQYVQPANGQLVPYAGYWVYAIKSGNLIMNAPH